MISTELLRRFPFFGPLSEDQLKQLAMITDEMMVVAGTKIFDERDPANAFYLLLEGAIDLTYKSEEEFHPKTRKVFPVGEVNPEEIFGISAVIEPYQYHAAAIAAKDCKVLIIDGAELRKLMEADLVFSNALMHQVAKAIMERLAYTRVQLAAAWA